MTNSKSIFACTFLLLLLSASAQVNTTATEAERKEEILSRLPTNSFVNDPVRGTETVKRMVALQNAIVDNGGCNPNLCFAIDGSIQIAPEDFGRQIDFMAVVAATAGASLGFEDQIHMAAYQYGGGLRTITELTRDVDYFLDRADATVFQPSRITFLAPAILHCSRQLKRRFTEDANMIVVMGDGRTHFRRPHLAIKEAVKFLPPNNNGAISAITVANPDLSFLTNLTQSAQSVLNVDATEEFIDLLEVVVKNVCDIV